MKRIMIQIPQKTTNTVNDEACARIIHVCIRYQATYSKRRETFQFPSAIMYVAVPPSRDDKTTFIFPSLDLNSSSIPNPPHEQTHAFSRLIVATSHSKFSGISSNRRLFKHENVWWSPVLSFVESTLQVSDPLSSSSDVASWRRSTL